MCNLHCLFYIMHGGDATKFRPTANYPNFTCRNWTLQCYKAMYYSCANKLMLCALTNKCETRKFQTNVWVLCC